MHKKLNYIILIILYLIICKCIYINNSQINTIEQNQNTYSTIANKITINKKETTDDSIGNLTINKINLNQKLYDIDSEKNNIEYNVTILKGSEDPKINNSIMFIAAHSGTGKIAYFKNLDKLNINDEIELKYKNIMYIYIIKDIWETEKNGNITVNKEDINQLVLTTCSQTSEDKQLIINAILKKAI